MSFFLFESVPNQFWKLEATKSVEWRQIPSSILSSVRVRVRLGSVKLQRPAEELCLRTPVAVRVVVDLKLENMPWSKVLNTMNTTMHGRALACYSHCSIASSVAGGKAEKRCNVNIHLPFSDWVLPPRVCCHESPVCETRGREILQYHFVINFHRLNIFY